MKIRVKITPNAKKKSLTIIQDLLTWEDVYDVKVHAKPVDGEANKALIDYLSDHFDLPKRAVRILKWHTSRMKIVEIDNM